MIGVLGDTWGTSFRRVMFLTARGLQRLGYNAVVLDARHPIAWVPQFVRGIIVGDTIFSIKMGWHRIHTKTSYKCIFWTDTPLELVNIAKTEIDIINNDCINVATSSDNAIMMENVGMKVATIIPRPIDLEAIEEAKRQEGKFKKKYGKYILTIGGDVTLNPGLFPRKGLDNLDKALGVIKGKLHEKGYKSVVVTNWVGRMKNPDVVIPMGSLNDIDIYTLIRDAVLFVFPSRREGFGMPPLEAMACGTPLVYTDAPAHNEFAVGFKVPIDHVVETVHHETGYPMRVYEYSYTMLADMILYVLDLIEKDSEEVHRLVREGLEKAKQFDSKVIAENLLRL